MDLLSITLDQNLSEFDRIKDNLKRFMNQKRSLRMNDLKVFFLSIQLIDNVDINFDGFKDKKGMNLEKFYIDNYNHLKDNLTFITRVDYGNLMAAVNEIPTDYFKKFNNLNSVCSDDTIVNEEHFLSFLKNIKKLMNVDINQNVSLKVVKSLVGHYSMVTNYTMKLPYNLDLRKLNI